MNTKQANLASNIKLEDFKEMVSDTLNYLFVSEDSVNLQTLYDIKDNFKRIKEKNNLKYATSIKEYDSIIKTTARFIKEMGLNGNHASYYTIFSYLLWGGYLSNNIKFTFSREKLVNIIGFQGLDIINGGGVCRTITNMQNSIFRELGYDTKFLINSFQTKYLKHIANIPRINGNGEMCIQRINALINSSTPDLVGDHASLLLNDGNNYYIYDSTNLLVYRLNSFLFGDLYNGDGECLVKPWGFIVYGGMEQDEILNLFSLVENQNSFTYMNDREMAEIIDETTNVCNKKKKLILDFHSQIKDNIDNIQSNIFCKR